MAPGNRAYSFYNAGVQIFNVADPAKPTIAGYFVPALADESELPVYTPGQGRVLDLHRV